MLEQDRDTGSRVTIQTWKKARILSPTPTRVGAKISKANEAKVLAIQMLNHLDQKYQPETKLD